MLLGLGLAFILVSLFVLVSALGLIIPHSTALAMAHYPDRAGTASALLGVLQFAVGGLVAPLVGVAGEDSAVPLGVVAASCEPGGLRGLRAAGGPGGPAQPGRGPGAAEPPEPLVAPRAER